MTLPSETELWGLALRALEAKDEDERKLLLSQLAGHAIAWRRIAHSEKARADRRNSFTVVTGEKR